MKVYLEIVGFWTREYLERKLRKLREVKGVDMLIAVHRSLACSKVEEIKENLVFYYEKEVPISPIMEYLKEREGKVIEKHAEILEVGSITLKGEVVDIEEIATEKGVSAEAVSRVLKGVKFDGYRLVGKYFISDSKLQDLRTKIEDLKDNRLSEVVKFIESQGIGNPYEVLEALGYVVEWRGLDMSRSTVRKIESEKRDGG